MGANAGSVSIDLDAKIAKFESDMGRAAKMMERDLARAAKTSQRALGDMERQAKAAGVAIGTALVAGATAAAYAIKKSIDAMDEMSKSAQRAGLPTEQFSKLAYAASLADVSMKDLEGTMGKLVKNQAAALKGTSEQAKVFAALGIAVTDSEGRMRSAGDVFADFADAFQRQQGSPEIMAAGFQVMGKSFQSIIPLIKDGSAGLRAAGIEAEQLGKVLSTKAGQDAERFNDNLTRLKSALAGATQEMALGMLPKLNATTDAMVAASKQTDDLRNFGEGLATVLGAVATAAGFVAKAVQTATIAMASNAEQMSGWYEIARNVSTLGMADGSVSGGWGTVKNAATTGRAMVAETWKTPAPALFQNATGGSQTSYDLAAQARARKDAESESKRLSATFGGTQRAAAKRGSAATPRKSDMPNFTKEDTDALRQAVQVAADAQARFADLAATLSGPLAQAQREHAKNLAEIDRLAKEGEQTTQATIELKALETERYKDQVSAIEAQLNPGRQLIADMQFENSLMRMGNAERETAIALRRANIDAMSSEGIQIAALNEARERESRAAQVQQQVQHELSDAIYGVISRTKSAKEAAGDFMDAMIEMVQRSIAEQWSKQIASWMMPSQGGMGGGGASGGGGGWGGLLNGLFNSGSSGNAGLSESQMYAKSISSGGLTGVSSAGSGGGFFSWLGGLFSGGRANGGPVFSNKMYEVNERGPELLSQGGKTFLMMGDQDGRVTPMDGGRGGGGGGVTFNATYQFDAPTSNKTQQQVSARTQRDLQEATRRSR